MKKTATAAEKKEFWLILLCLVSYTTVYIGKKNFSVCLPDMIADGVFDKGTGGVIGTVFLASYAAGQLVNGWLGDRFHPRFVVPFGLFLAGLMNVTMSVLSSVPLFIVVWGLCGYACSMLWPSIIRAVSEWLSEKAAQDSAAALAVTIPVGTILSYLVCALMLKLSGWRAAFAACGTVLMIVAVFLYFFFARLKDFMQTKPKTAEEKKQESGASLGAILCFGMLMTAVGILCNGMLKDGLDLWIPTALKEIFTIDASLVSLICTVLPIFNIAGVYVAKYVFGRFHMTELGTTGAMFAVSGVSLGVVLLILKTGATGYVTAGIVTLLLATSSASMLGANTMLLNYLPLHYGKIGRAALVSGALNCFSYAAASASSVATGVISDSLGWNGVFLCFLIATLVGCVGCVAGRKNLWKHTKQLDEM